MLAINDGMVSLRAALEQAGRWDSTVAVFTSDNALTMGEHRLDNKGFAYEESARVPFVVRLPGVPAEWSRARSASSTSPPQHAPSPERPHPGRTA